MSQDLTERTFWQQKSLVRYLQRKKDLVIVNNYRKFEEIVFTNNKDMSVCLFVCFVALRPKSTAMVIAGRSVHLTTPFPWQA